MSYVYLWEMGVMCIYGKWELCVFMGNGNFVYLWEMGNMTGYGDMGGHGD